MHIASKLLTKALYMVQITESNLLMSHELCVSPVVGLPLVCGSFQVYNWFAVWGGGEMVDAADLKSAGRQSVWVRIPPALLTINLPLLGHFLFVWMVLEEGALNAKARSTVVAINGAGGTAVPSHYRLWQAAGWRVRRGRFFGAVAPTGAATGGKSPGGGPFESPTAP